MNKKILFLILLIIVIIFPSVALGAVAPTTTLTGMTDKLKTTMITIGGAVVIIGWVVAGILYLTAGGQPDKLGIAKKALVACVIGTVLIILADAANTIISVIKSALGL